MPSPGNVYLLRDVDCLTGNVSTYLKIGKSVDSTAARIKKHQTGNPRVIIDVGTTNMPYMTDAETYLHHWFSSDRIHGEWFDIDPTRKAAEVDPKIAQLLIEQTAYEANEAIIDGLKTTNDNGTVRAPTTAESQLSNELKNAREALKIAKAQHEVADYELRAQIGANNGIQDIVRLTEKIQADYFDQSAFIASLTTAQRLLCFVSGTEFKSKETFHNKGDSLNVLNAALNAQKSAAKSAAPTSISLGNLANPELPRTTALETMHRQWLSTRRAIKEQQWLIKQKEAALKVSIGLDREITGVLTWERGNVAFTDRFSKADAKANLAAEVAAFTSARPNHVAVEINECRPYP